VDRNIVTEKLESLRRCVLRIESKRDRLAGLEEDFDAQDVIALNLERAVQTAVDISAHLVSELEVSPPETMAGVFPVLEEAGILSAPVAERMKKAVGFRNICVHQYKDIDWAIVKSIVTDDLEDFTNFAREISRFVDSEN